MNPPLPPVLEVARLRIADQQLGLRAFTLSGQQKRQPRDALQLLGIRAPPSLVQRQVLGGS